MSTRVIGLTGPIGAGKTTVAAMLRELGAKVLDADAIVHDEQSRGTVGYSAIVQTFGTEVLGVDGEIDRGKLAAIVFGDPAKLTKLERILHPRVIARILQAREMLKDGDVLVVEAIKLLESGLRSICDEIWVVVAPREEMLRRLGERGLGRAEAEMRLGSQRTMEEFLAAADVVIENDADRDRARAQVQEAWARGSRPR